jgi:glycosyl transferase family 25
MRVFLINLGKNADRLDKSASQLNALGVSFERVEAVYGKNLSIAEKRKAVNKFRWWCAQGRKIRDGEIGCALSHFAIYKTMLKGNIDFACILEDDNVYRDNFKQILNEIEGLVDSKKPQVVLLSNCTDDRPFADGTQIVKSKGDQWTSSYVITLPAARAILKANLPIQAPCDSWRRWSDRRLISLYHAFPTIAVQDGHPLFAYGIEVGDPYSSDIEGDVSDRVSSYSICRKLFHKLKRAIGVAIDAVLPL